MTISTYAIDESRLHGPQEQDFEVDPALGAVRKGLRSSVRFGRVSLFLAETLARQALDGVSERSAEAARELCWVCENLTALSGVRPRVLGPVPSGPCVMVANHVSYLDPIILAGLVPCIPIAKGELRTWPVLGDAARRASVLFVQRDSAWSGAMVLRKALRVLEQGVSVLVFPEGTTTSGRAVLPFRRGALGAARLANVPVVPVALRYAEPSAAWIGEDTFLPHYTRTLARPFTSATLRFLPAIESVRAHSAESLADLARTAIAGQLGVGDLAPRPHRGCTDHVQLATA